MQALESQRRQRRHGFGPTLLLLGCLLQPAVAQVAPSQSLAEQMRAMLAKPAPRAGTTAPAAAATTPAPAGLAGIAALPAARQGGGVGVFDAPLQTEGPVQIAQSAAELAQRFPADKRAAMARAYEASFSFWQKLETQLGLTPNDLAAGVAAFIAGNYAAFMQQQVPDEQFKTLVLQMQGVLAQSPVIRQASPATRRSLFEQMAMVGTFMAVYREQLSRKPSPNEEQHFRDAARANLELALGVPVERMVLGEHGLEVR